MSLMNPGKVKSGLEQMERGISVWTHKWINSKEKGKD